MALLKYVNFRKQFKTAMKQFSSRLRPIANRCNFENDEKHIKTQLILGTHSQKLRKFCFTNPTVSLKEVVNRAKLFEEVDKQAGVVEGSKSINEIKNLEKMNNHCKYSLNHYKNRSTN